MGSSLKKQLAAAMCACTLSTTVAIESASAANYVRVRTSNGGYAYVRERTHPVIRGTVIGGALGAGIGAIGGAIAGHHRAGRGALAGLGAGAGIGAINSAHQFRRHPIIRDTATGTLLGGAVGYTMRKRGATWKGAGIGALTGAGIGVLRRAGSIF